MKRLRLNEINEGMILAAPIILGDGDVELLGKGVKILQRHIKLMTRLGIMEAYITEDDVIVKDLKLTNKEQVELIQKNAKKLGKNFDAVKYKKQLDEIDLTEDDIIPVLTNVANANMVINILTGDGNIPIDEKHKDLVEHTQRAFEKLRTSNDLDLASISADIEKALPDMIRNDDVLMRLSQLKAGDNYTFHHSLRVSILATMVGKWLGYSHAQLCELAQAALLFDIGKLKIPEFVLNKPNRTKEEEFEIIKKHAQFGYSILLRTAGVTNSIKYSALQHHERIDGTGYPLRLKSGQIHEFAKIIMVADIFDAMITERPYKQKVSAFTAAEYIQWNSGKTLDGKICYIFLKNLAVFFTGKEVLLSTNERGKIIYIDVNFPTRPVIQVGDKFIDLVKEKQITIVELYN